MHLINRNNVLRINPGIPTIMAVQKTASGQNCIRSTSDNLKSAISIAKQVLASKTRINVLSIICSRVIGAADLIFDHEINRFIQKRPKMIHGKYNRNRVMLVSNDIIIFSFIRLGY